MISKSCDEIFARPEIELKACLDVVSDANRMILEDEPQINDSMTESEKPKTRHDDPLAFKTKMISLSNWLLHYMSFTETLTLLNLNTCLNALAVADQAINSKQIELLLNLDELPAKFTLW